VVSQSLTSQAAQPQASSAGQTIAQPDTMLANVERQIGTKALQMKLQKRSAARNDASDEAVQAAGAAGTGGPGGELPHAASIQRSFGRHDVSGVVAHVGGEASTAARAMGAEAFATGNHVVFDGSPSLHTAAHEAAHVVQQRGGVHLKGGVGETGDPYERHADVVADMVVQGKSAESLLDQHAGGGAAAGLATQRKEIQKKGKTKEEHQKDVEQRSTNSTVHPGFLPTLQDREKAGLLSADHTSEELHSAPFLDDKKQKLELNTKFEEHLGHNLEGPTTEIAKGMSLTVGGYQSHAGAQNFIKQNLASKQEDVEKKPKPGDQAFDFSEGALMKSLETHYPEVAHPGAYAPNAEKLSEIRANMAFLKAYKGRIDGDPKATDEVKRHFRKIFYTYKLSEMLQAQLGYFGGSIEFKAGLENDLEYWVYLLSTKTRGPQQQSLDPSPKPMLPYKTPEKSLLPKNNQFSMSIGHAEFENADSIPKAQRDELEKKLAAFQKDVKNVEILDKLVGKKDLNKAPKGTWTLAELIKNLDENRRKALFSDHLRIPWSTKDAHNPFQGHDDKLARVQESDIHDPRVLEQVQPGGKTPQQALAEAQHPAHVTGGKANILLTPESASHMFQKKLESLSLEQLQATYGKFIEGMDKDTAVGTIVDDAEKKTKDWFATAKLFNKPITAGPSGHTLGYLNLYRDAYDADESKPKEERVQFEKPTLEKARLVMLASLIGNKEHHSYDEVLIASAGIESEKKPIVANKLSYIFRSNYGEMSHSHTDGVAEAAAAGAKKSVQGEYEKKEDFKKPLETWLKNVY
jgi:hypothetical protein